MTDKRTFVEIARELEPTSTTPYPDEFRDQCWLEIIALVEAIEDVAGLCGQSEIANRRCSRCIDALNAKAREVAGE